MEIISQLNDENRKAKAGIDEIKLKMLMKTNQYLYQMNRNMIKTGPIKYQGIKLL